MTDLRFEVVPAASALDPDGRDQLLGVWVDVTDAGGMHLSVRGEEGLEAFYERFGYRVVGVHPGAVRLGPTDTRDEIFMAADLWRWARPGRPANLDR